MARIESLYKPGDTRLHFVDAVYFKSDAEPADRVDRERCAQSRQIFEQCVQLVRAQATVMQLATRSESGILRLSGVAVRGQSILGWRNSTGPMATGTHWRQQ
jgi:hypothetical protein